MTERKQRQVGKTSLCVCVRMQTSIHVCRLHARYSTCIHAAVIRVLIITITITITTLLLLLLNTIPQASRQNGHHQSIASLRP